MAERLPAAYRRVGPPAPTIRGSRPGLALAYARAPEAVLIRAELTRVLLDLTAARPSARLAAAKAAVPRAIELSALLTADPAAAARSGRTNRRRGAAPTPSPAVATEEPTDADATDETDGTVAAPKTPATDRRRGVETIVGLWADVARDLALIETGGARSVRDTVMLEELGVVAGAIGPGAAVAFLGRTARAAELLASNVSPELVLDALVLAWPAGRAAA